MICVNPVDVRVRRTGTVGQLIGDADVRIVRDGKEVEGEEEGEIWVAGPFVFKVVRGGVGGGRGGCVCPCFVAGGSSRPFIRLDNASSHQTQPVYFHHPPTPPHTKL